MSNPSIQQELAKIETAIAAQEGLRGTLPDAQIDATLTQLRQKQAELTAQLLQTPGTSSKATLKGSGAIAHGAGTTAVGERGVNVSGNVGGSIITGGQNMITQVGGDMVQGDKVGGDKVGGDKNTIGDITNSAGIAMGREAQAHVAQGISGSELTALFQAVHKQIEARPADPNVEKEEIAQQAQKIEQEATASQPNENKLERWIRHLADMAPDIVDVMAASLSGPVAGTAAVIKKIVAKVKKEA